MRNSSVTLTAICAIDVTLPNYGRLLAGKHKSRRGGMGGESRPSQARRSYPRIQAKNVNASPSNLEPTILDSSKRFEQQIVKRT